MIAFSENNVSYIVYSIPYLCRVISPCYSIKTLLLKENILVWKVDGIKNCIMIGFGNLKAGDVLRYEEGLFNGCKKVTYESVLTKIRPRMYEIAKDNKLIDEDGMFSYRYYIAQGSKIFKIRGVDIMALEHLSCDCYYEDVIYACFDNYDKLPTMEKLFNTGKDCEKAVKTKVFPILVSDTKSMKANLIHEDGSIEELYDL